MHVAIKWMPVIVGVAGSIACAFARDGGTKPRAASGFAVVELFTSEGCSSCPPADDALADLIKASNGKHVFALAFHVDYWDSIGWADPFADAAYSDRQREYAKTMKLDSIYTPQAIVNGQREFVGSNRAQLKDAVADALSTPATGTIAAKAKRADGAISLDLTATGLPADVVIHVALVESGLSSNIVRGENRGRTLKHDNVVRVFRSTTIKDGHAALQLPIAAGVSTERSQIILYAQRPGDLHVLTATEVEIPK